MMRLPDFIQRRFISSKKAELEEKIRDSIPTPEELLIEEVIETIDCKNENDESRNATDTTLDPQETPAMEEGDDEASCGSYNSEDTIESIVHYVNDPIYFWECISQEGWKIFP